MAGLQDKAETRKSVGDGEATIIDLNAARGDAAPCETFGEILARARRASGEALDDVVIATKIKRAHLEALEASDFGALPAVPFAAGFVKVYATHLGLDAAALVQRYKDEVEAAAPATVDSPSREPPSGPAIRRETRFASLLGVGAVGFFAIWMLVQILRSPEAAGDGAPAAPRPRETAQTLAAPAQSPATHKLDPSKRDEGAGPITDGSAPGSRPDARSSDVGAPGEAAPFAAGEDVFAEPDLATGTPPPTRDGDPAAPSLKPREAGAAPLERGEPAIADAAREPERPAEDVGSPSSEPTPAGAVEEPVARRAAAPAPAPAPQEPTVDASALNAAQSDQLLTQDAALPARAPAGDARERIAAGPTAARPGVEGADEDAAGAEAGAAPTSILPQAASVGEAAGPDVAASAAETPAAETVTAPVGPSAASRQAISPPVFTPAEILRRPTLGYPRRCRRGAAAREEVVLTFDVGVDGRATNIAVASSSNACFNDAGVRAVERMRFSPATAGGAPQVETGRKATLVYPR